MIIGRGVDVIEMTGVERRVFRAAAIEDYCSRALAGELAARAGGAARTYLAVRRSGAQAISAGLQGVRQR